MACSSCSKRRQKQSNRSAVYDVMGGYKYLPDNQVKARLEVFKKKHCQDCENRYECTFDTYIKCSKRPK